MPNSEDLDNVIEFYHTVWGLKPSDAADQAFEDQRRGENSPIWKARVEQANNWVERHPQVPAKLASEPVPLTVPKPITPEPNPESAMADPRLVDPAAASAQDALDSRRAKLAAMPPTIKPATVGLEPMYQFYRNGLNLAPEEAMKRAGADYQQGLANANAPDVPISPAPLKPAAPTPQHLEDANLSSWQSLANFLGYQNAR